MSILHRIAYGAALRVGTHSPTELRRLRELQWASRAEVDAYVEIRLGSLIEFAAERVPYYRRVWGHAPPRGGNILRRFSEHTPLLEKRLLRERFDELTAVGERPRGRYVNQTGGSTGEPVRFLQDGVYRDANRAVKLLFDEWAGSRLGERRALLWGSERDLFVGRETLRFRATRLIKNEIILNAFRMGPDVMRSHLDRLNRFRADSLHAYAESAYELARFAEEEKIEVHALRSVVCSAGTLYPHMREIIERVFGTSVTNRYGSREFGGIACQCPVGGGLHVCAPTHYVEVLRADGSPADPGEEGEIVVTGLVNRAMPLIRYRIGDRGAWAVDECPCGRRWPLLAAVSGRVTSVVLRPGGGSVPPEYFIHLIGVVLNTGWIQRFQVVQETIDRIRVLIVPVDALAGAMSGDAEAQVIRERVRLAVGSEVTVLVERVDDIPVSPSGKYQYVLSHVARSSPGQMLQERTHE